MRPTAFCVAVFDRFHAQRRLLDEVRRATVCQHVDAGRPVPGAEPALSAQRFTGPP
jgi:hypothetical protein